MPAHESPAQRAGPRSDLAASLAISMLAHVGCDGTLEVERGGEEESSLRVRCNGCGGLFEYPVAALIPLLDERGRSGARGAEPDAPASPASPPVPPPAPAPVEPTRAAPGPDVPVGPRRPGPGSPPDPAAAEAGEPGESPERADESSQRVVAVPYRKEESALAEQPGDAEGRGASRSRRWRRVVPVLVIVALIAIAVVLVVALDDDDGEREPASPQQQGSATEGRGAETLRRTPGGDVVIDGRVRVELPDGWRARPADGEGASTAVELTPANTNVAVSIHLERSEPGSIAGFAERTQELLAAMQPEAAARVPVPSRENLRVFVPYPEGSLLARATIAEAGYVLAIARIPRLAPDARSRQARQILAGVGSD